MKRQANTWAARSLAFLLVFLAAGLAAGAARAQGPIASGSLKIQGNRLTVYADDLTTDADQTVNVGERARVRTCFGSVDTPCGNVLPGDPRIAGMLVRAELRGPEVPQPVTMETVPGGSFVLPGFQQEGDYRLENIRLVDEGSGQVLATAEPSLAILHVREILLASATVRTLSLAELQARGITLSAENFQAFNFAVGFAFGDEIVKIEFPMVYTGYGTVEPLDKPTVNLDNLPPDVAHAVERWQPPHIVPFKLEVDEDDQALRAGEEEDEALRLPLFGAIVLPGNVSYLNQFFEARLVVANGAPAGSDARLGQVQAVLRLPPQNVLRVVASDPSVSPGQAVPVVKANGGRLLFPGEQGAASWTVEGLVAGTHTLQMDITASLERPGRDPFPLLSRIQAAVEVVDARFNLTFSHPDVVREGEAYSLFVTVTNLSRAAQNLVTVDLDRQRMTGAHPFDSQDTLRRTIQTLAPGQSETLEYRLVADLDGKVVATTFQSTSAAGQGTIRLRTGVGELGIPLSPATLVLPRFSERLKTPHLDSDELLRAHTRFLGLAYSLAVAPAALTPSGLPRVIKSDVERRAVDFAQAGQRTWLGEGLLESLEVLALDALGNRHPLIEMDELRRATGKGLAFGTELAREIRQEQVERNLTAEALFDHFAETTTYTAPYAAALLVPDEGSEGLTLEVRGAWDGIAGRLTGAAGAAGSQRTLAFGEIFPVRRFPSDPETVPFALVGHVALDQVLEVVVRNPGSVDAEAQLLIVVPGPDGEEDRRLELSDLVVPAGRSVVVRVGGAIANPAAVDAETGAPAGAPSVAWVERPPFRLIGAVQDFRMKEDGPDFFGNMIRPNRYGNGVVYLFNRPPETQSAERSGNYRIRSRFQGLDTAGQSASGTSEKVGTGAWVQDDGRTVAVRYALPLSALMSTPSQPLLTHEHLLDTRGLVDKWGEMLDPDVPDPTLEVSPLHIGGLVAGRVLRGDGTPVAGAKVQLIRPLLWETMADTVVKLDYLGEVTTGADGAFLFDFIETPHWDKQVLQRFTLRAIIPAGSDPKLQPEEVQEVSSTIRLQNRMVRINIALLGRGTVTGRLLYADNGAPVSAAAGGTVRATSTLFNEEKAVVPAADGSFAIPGVPVGPITLTGRDRDGRVVYATVGISAPGASAEVVLLMPRVVPGLGTVAGTVVGATSGEPIAGARVTVYSKGAALSTQETDEFGRFRFDQVPEGQVSLQAANWSVSRMPVFTDLLLAANETKEIELRLPEGASRTVTGLVYFHDPITNTNVPVQGAVAFIEGPGVFAYTDSFGRYRIEGVPVQGAGERYSVKAIDFNRKLEGKVQIEPILDTAPDVVQAQAIVLQQMTGGLDGIVLDPLGRPVGNAEVVVYPYGKVDSGPDGSFSFRDLPIGSHTIVAHQGDGLEAGRVGYFGDATAQIAYGGHRPFVAVRMRGAGVVNILTKTATATGVQTPIYYKPTYYSAVEYSIRIKGAYIATQTDPNGVLQIALPVGPYEIVAYNPFHGMQTINGRIDYAGQVVDHEVVFEDAASVAGQVVNVDGVTPVPNAEVVLEASGLKGQTQRTDAQGRFRFELVPKGRVMVTATGLAGTVERVGRTLGYVGTAGQELELVVQMKAQGTVSGRIVDRFNGVDRPLANAHYYVQENTFPFRRLPEEGTWLSADSQGRYQVPHVYAGNVTVVARDSGQVGRYGSVDANLTTDWQVLQMPDIVMTTSVGALQVTVRDPVSGGPVADAQVRLSNDDATVTGPDGIAFFDALPLGTYSVSVFYAPNGQSGRLSNVTLASPGQKIARLVYLDQRGEVRGTLWDDAAMSVPVAGGVVRLEGETAGGRVTALSTSSSADGSKGRFEFLGIPEGTFQLEAAAPTSPRRASASAVLTATAPIIDLNLVLEPDGILFFRLFEKLKTGPAAVNVSGGGLFSVRLTQPGSGGRPSYDYAQITPESGGSFKFPNVLLSRPGSLAAEELIGERRKGGASFTSFTAAAPPVDGAGTQASPYQIVLSPKGTVRVFVRDAAGLAVQGANVTLSTADGPFPSVSGADGSVTFAAVPAGQVNASASLITNGTGGFSTATLTYDDELVEMAIALSPAVSARGVIYQPVADDRWNGDLAQLVPAAGIIVELRDAKGRTQLVLTDAQGSYRFGALATGGYQLAARSSNGDQLASRTGTLAGPDGNVNEIPALILDAAPPRLLSIAPPPGLEGVSLTAPVELVFSEPLLAAVLPVNAGNPHPYFSLRSAKGTWAAGTWSSSLDAAGRQVVRFVPSTQYEDFTVYSLAVLGGTGGVRDRMGRPLTTSGNIGSNFKTSDTSGPAVIGSDPDLARPVDPRRPIRFDLSEAVKARDAQLDGDFVGDAVELYWQRNAGGSLEWRRLPVTLYLTRSNYSIVVQPVEGVTLDGDTLQRQVVITGLEDVYGNVMPKYERTFRMWDGRAPRIDAVPLPTPDGKLLQGTSYTLTPLLASLDDVTPANLGGDIDRVDYFFEDPRDPARPVSPSYSARQAPFSYTFVGVYVGDGTAPRPFPVWVRAVDTSTNQSNVMDVQMEVLPNNQPSLESVAASATSPVPGVFYAGSSLLANVDGFHDRDSSQVTLFVELWQEDASAPMAQTSGVQVTRPPAGWYDAPTRTAPFQIPVTLEEGTRLYFRARVIDPNGAIGVRESERFVVADDSEPPQLDDFSARLAGAPVTHLFIGEELYLEVRARDRETAISEITIALDRTDLFPQALTATRVPGTTDLYRTGTLLVPAVTAQTPVTASLQIRDHGGNLKESSIRFEIGPERDPAAPTARWISPWQGALWPADYTSTVSSSEGAALLLRFYARDTNLDVDGNPVPGKLVNVEVRGPRRNAATGELELAGTWLRAEKVAGTEDLAGAVYQALWRLPNGIAAGTDIPFETRLLDSAGTETIGRVTMTAVPPREVYEATQYAITPEKTMRRDGWSEDGPVFLVGGATVSVYPQTDGSVRRLPALFAYSGASTDTGTLVVSPSVLTAPETLSYSATVPFQPLELAIDQELGVGMESRVDMTGKGLLGNKSNASVVLSGETAAQSRAGGSHGGRGWFGSSNGWERTDLTQPGTTYGSLRDPRLPGGGGGSPDTNPAGNGGGVIRLLAETARIHLDGSLVANGGTGSGGGGAGGSIRLAAARLEGRGRIEARGGAGADFNTTGGGGGGRVSITYRELGSGMNLATQVDVSGGHNHAADANKAVRRGGAGTLWVEVVDPETGVPGPGRLVLRNPAQPERAALSPLPALGDGAVHQIDPATARVVLAVSRVQGTLVGDQVVLAAADGRPLGSFPIVAQQRQTDAAAPGGARIALTVAATPEQLDPAAAELAQGKAVAFHGVSRLLAVEAEGTVRLVADDDLLLKAPGAEALNDRASIALLRGARALLRGEAPVVTFITQPAPGSDVLLGSTVQVTGWSVSDPLGLADTSTESSSAPTPQVKSYYDQPVTAASTASASLSIPITGAPASVSYTVQARNLAGRVTRTPAVWPVLPNQAPAGQVGLAAGTQTPLRAGYTFTAVVHAEDRERLQRVTLQATGPVDAASQSQAQTANGLAADLSFTVKVLAAADSSQPVVLQALIEDASGGSTATAPLSLPVAANGAPTGSVGLSPGAPGRIEPGQSTTILVHAEDADGLTKIELQAAGAVTQPAQSQTVSGTVKDATFTLTAAAGAAPQTVSVTATIHDQLGSSATTAPFTFQIAGDVDKPVIVLTLDPDRGAAGVYRPGETVAVRATATDDVAVTSLALTVDGQTTASTGAPVEAAWTVPAVTARTSFTFAATASDGDGNTATLERTVAAEPQPADPLPAVAFTCPTQGAVLPTDYTVSLAAAASDNAGVTRIRFFQEDAATHFAEVVPGAPATQATAGATFDLATATGPTVRLRVEATDTAGQVASHTIEIQRVSVVDLVPDGPIANDWGGALRGRIVALRSGTLTLDPQYFTEVPMDVAGLLVLDGATLAQRKDRPMDLELSVDGPLYVGCNGVIDVTARGYAKDTTHPGHRGASNGNGGSHMGEGGMLPPPETFGSVYFPQERGGGGHEYGSGGGALQIAAERVQVDGQVLANGENNCRGGAGGSVWIQAGVLAGAGSIEARGGNATCGGSGSGGGGAISIRYDVREAGTALTGNLRAQGGSTQGKGGAGTVYLRGSEHAYGELILDNGTVGGSPRTFLPALGRGVAQPGSGGATLVTDRAKVIPQYFVGHWVEVRDGATGALEGTWRVELVDSDSRTVTLGSEDGAEISVDEGDLWQGVYRFDRATVRGSIRLESPDPIRVAGEQVIAGTVETTQVSAGNLTIKPGAVLKHPAAATASTPSSLSIEVGELVVETGGAIDVSSRGYGPNTTYPQHGSVGSGNGGSHLGEGGVQNIPLPETFGSVYFPQEHGSGSSEDSSKASGGGVVRIVAERVRVDGAVRANGESACRGGAGGSVWIRTNGLAGAGAIESRGGTASCGSSGAGGGGAISIEYGELEGGATLLANLKVPGGTTGATSVPGGAGTVYLRSGAQSYGELTVDNTGVSGSRRTILPSLGKGVAQPGSGGATLATDRAKAIPPYFVGHWVEVRSATGELRGTWRIRSIAADGFAVTLASPEGGPVTVEPGDAWQGVYRFDGYTVRGEVRVESADPIRVLDEQVITGVVETTAIRAGRLVIKPGAVLTQPAPAAGAPPSSLSIEVGELVVEAGGAIDVSARGYRPSTTYPGHGGLSDGNGGSHLGQGGVRNNPPAETFGSVYFPQESGGGSSQDSSKASGGGAVRIVAERVRVDGAIRANGESACRGAAGGSVWIRTGGLAGAGTIESRGGNASCGSSGAGGGGAISVHYGELDPEATLLANLKVPGGTTGATSVPGGAGTVYLRSGAQSYGELTIDNAAVTGSRRTILPALGGGTARSGSGGATLVTGRAKAIPPYFAGHWVEVRDAATGTLEGAWRVQSIGVDGVTVVLASNAGEPVTVDEGDVWQGVYRFDGYTVRGEVRVESPDPIRVEGSQVIAGTVETTEVRAGRLEIQPGAVLKHPAAASSSTPSSLSIEVGELVVKAGGAIDVSSRGYGPNTTYPGHGGLSSANGGSHLGEGGVRTNPPAETFGSVYFPKEHGGGSSLDSSTASGGGVVRITAERVQVDGQIRANGESSCRGGAGGSVWIRTDGLAGAGAIESRGGNASCGSSGAGGGGAISIEYGAPEAGTALLDNLRAPGGTTGATSSTGGAGTVYLRSATQSYGELIVDNTGVSGNRRTVLPALGKGLAQAGSGGATLATGRPKAIPPYFVGHWVEVRDAATRAVKGIWRIASIGADGLTVTLAAEDGGPVTVEAGDAWQGIYRFDRYAIRGQLQVASDDPVHVYSEQVITGTVETATIHATSLVVEPGAVLTQPLTTSAASPGSLTIEVGSLTVKAGGKIDLTGRGYGPGTTYPGHTAAGYQSGGSHLGEGGNGSTAGQTFGSVTFPRENGGGSGEGGRGGGALRIIATGRVQVDGEILANSPTACQGGAGGSVWIQAGELAGAGRIEARGGNRSCGGSSGGGGAMALEYAALDPASTLLDHLSLQGGSLVNTGGGGTLYVRGPGANLGSLVVNNGDVGGTRPTILPSLGRGIVQPGSSGGTVVTGRDADVPAYFVGHWVEVEGPDRFVKGIWRIAAINGTTIHLEPKAGQPFEIAAGDRWRGLYRFDQVTVASNSLLVSEDRLVQIVPPLPDGAARRSSVQSATGGSYEGLYGNGEAPAWERSAVSIAVGSLAGSYRITLAPNALSDLDGLSEVRLTSGGRSLAAEWSPEGVSFLWPGRPGQRLHLVATDAHPRFRRSGWLELPALPAGDWSTPLELAPGVTPLAVTGGADWLAVADDAVWLYGTGPQPVATVPPRSKDDEVVALAAQGDLLLAATRDRIDVLDRATEGVEELAAPAAVLDLAPGDGEAIVLLSDESDPDAPALRLAQLLLTAGEPPVLSAPGELALPRLQTPALHRTGDALHLLGVGPEGQGVIYTWPATVPGEPVTATPDLWETPEGWRATGAWERGAVVLDGTAVRLLEHGAAGWTEVSRIDLPAEAWSAAVAGAAGDILVVILPGEVLLYDVADPAQPTLRSQHPGSSHREVEPLPDGQVLLWSPRMAAPPLRWDPAAAVPGEGFQTVIPGLP